MKLNSPGALISFSALVVIAVTTIIVYMNNTVPLKRPAQAVTVCSANNECQVRGKDEFESCHHVNDPTTPEQQAPAHDATSKTHDGYACMCVSRECRWADKQYQVCVNTGGRYSRREDCAVCPADAVCEACFIGCQCAAGQAWDKVQGCVAQ